MTKRGNDTISALKLSAVAYSEVRVRRRYVLSLLLSIDFKARSLFALQASTLITLYNLKLSAVTNAEN